MKKGLIYKKGRARKAQVGIQTTGTGLGNSGGYYSDSDLIQSPYVKSKDIFKHSKTGFIPNNGAQASAKADPLSTQVKNASTINTNLDQYRINKTVDRIPTAAEMTSINNATAGNTVASTNIAPKVDPNSISSLFSKSANGDPSKFSSFVSSKNMSSGASAGIGMAANLAGGFIGSKTGDNDITTYTGKEAFGDIASKSVTAFGTTLAATGNPIIAGGTALVVGAIESFKIKGRKEEADKHLAIETSGNSNKKDAVGRKADSNQDSTVLKGLVPTKYKQNSGQQYGYNTVMTRRGGKFAPVVFTESSGRNSLRVFNPDAAPPVKFKRGGRIKETENIIPNGVLHEEKNSLGDKGMPVVKCKEDVCEKQYEIEKDEMILTLVATKKMEVLAKGNKFKELGDFVKREILQNTHSFTQKYKELNTYTKKDESIFA